jgi:hypothetical protein
MVESDQQNSSWDGKEISVKKTSIIWASNRAPHNSNLGKDTVLIGATLVFAVNNVTEI